MDFWPWDELDEQNHKRVYSALLNARASKGQRVEFDSTKRLADTLLKGNADKNLRKIMKTEQIRAIYTDPCANSCAIVTEDWSILVIDDGIHIIIE